MDQKTVLPDYETLAEVREQGAMVQLFIKTRHYGKRNRGAIHMMNKKQAREMAEILLNFAKEAPTS